ncbi:exodeoxyribonuclease VII large subunit [Halobacteriaceae bacterium SHR40]|uniref:exodeoxyribonuclease VII large subunit n=1 Tax=Halovenus amylolytica TaxID=2500550 RepID=UPI000FE2EA8E
MDFLNSDSEASGGILPEGAWTVDRFNHEIERVLNDSHDRFPTHVIGEIAEVDHYHFGTFFELRDLDEEPVISCLAWADQVSGFDHELAEGTKAVVEATVDFYPNRGDCQLLVFDYWPLGESARQEQLQALRNQLEQEGLFDEERKQSIPAYPACVGLVTSPSGSAREDTWAAISDRSPRTTVKLHGATVQGEDAVRSVITAIQSLDHDSAVETIIVTRGGGSDTDLWCFNAEPLVRCLAACATPVVVAIGHEDDETLVEYVADARAMTPTEAGVTATTPVETVLERLATTEQGIDTAYQTLAEEHLEQVDRRIETAVDSLRQQHLQTQSVRQRASDLEQRIGTAYRTLVETRLEAIDSRLDQHLQERELVAESEAASARAARRRLSDLEARIDGAYQTHVERILQQSEQRITDAYRELETQARITTSTAEARKLCSVESLAGGAARLS